MAEKSSVNRYCITIEYDGTHFVGWQRQISGLSVQAAIEDAILKFSGESVIVYGAGRTDAGVHAAGQVAHFDLSKAYAPHVIKNAINHFVKPNIAILSVKEVDEHFHARFSAMKKRYIYRIINRDTHSALMRYKAWLVKEWLDVDLMSDAVNILIGKHDFTSFRAVACQSRSAIKTVDTIHVHRDNDMINITFEGKSFLYNQVRIMSSALKNIGTGKWTHEKLLDVLLAKDRKCGPATAPAHGLYLEKIWYYN